MSKKVCAECGSLNENYKDWKSPDAAKVYVALAMADTQEQDDSIPNWLNRNGFANLTCCPDCHCDDFTHVEGCLTALKMDIAARQIEALMLKRPV